VEEVEEQGLEVAVEVAVEEEEEVVVVVEEEVEEEEEVRLLSSYTCSLLPFRLSYILNRTIL
jgi:hypothetical protein